METTQNFASGTEKLDTFTNRMSGSLERGKERLSDMGTNLMHKSKEVARLTDDCVHRNVWTSVLASAGVGLLIGMLIRRR
jgi:ElaB/YqjD/DUF883 family membrane-anchored ribosome-binding protein